MSKKPKIDKGKGKGKSSDECVALAHQSLNTFDESEIKEFMNDIFDKAYQYKDLGGNAAIKQALDEYKNEMRAILLGRCAIKANNISKFEKMVNLIKEKGVKLSSFIRYSAKNKGHNVENAQRARKNQLMTYFFDDLSQDEVQFLMDRKNLLDIATAYDTGKYRNDFEKVLAEKFRNYFKFQKEVMVESNAMPIEFLNQDRYFGNLHDRSKIIAGGRSMAESAISVIKGNAYKTENSGIRWREFIKTKVDLEKMFKNSRAMKDDGSLDMKIVDDILDNTYRNIVEGRSEIFTRSAIRNDREAVQNRSRQFFVWKGMREAMEYSQEYGSGSLFQEFIKDLNMTANRSGMADIFGDSLESMMNDLKRVALDSGQSNSSVKGAEKLMNEARGYNQLEESPAIETFLRSQRTITAMSRLGSIALLSISDISNSAAAVFRHGFGVKGFIETATHNIKNLFNNPLMNSEARKHIAKLFKVDIDTTIGYAGKFYDENNVGNQIDKFGNQFFYWSGMTGYDKGMRTGTLGMLAKQYGTISTRSFDKLNGQMQYIWKQHNLNEHEWNVLRTKTSNIKGEKYFSIDSVDQLSKDELKSLWDKSDKLIPFSGYKNSLYRNVYSMFETTVENAVNNPAMFEKLISSGGGVKGAWGGLIKSFMQFKSYPIGMFRRTYWEAFQDLQGAQAKILYATSLIVMTAPLAYMSQWLGYAAKGQTMPDFDEMNFSQKRNFIISMMSPGLGIFMTVLDPERQNNQMLTNFISTPSIKLLSDELAVVAKIGSGDFKDLDKRLKEIIGSIAPISTVPGIEPYFNRLLDKKPYMQPGQEMYGWAQE